MKGEEKKELIRKFNFSDELMGKIEHSVDILRKAEAMALDFYEKGFYLCFSGGKDSQALYHMAVLAGVKFEANMNMTIDENILTSNMKFKRVDDIAGYPCYTDGRYEISETEYGFIVHPDKDRILKNVKDFIGIAYPGAFFLIV